ncbi:hypothetical protein LUZ63_001857 [Rhynchospora breviuscula]|uniref:Uncharacterized protein n=1 Tax=Rhynchospora breviuscula TaxID=2022672 RepID=A0A9Q0CY67_9POAL|nr:hypothetical protein LUZ63_001857 [Rhynchospora breviuscula]
MLASTAMQPNLQCFLLTIFLFPLHSKAGKPAEPLYDTEGHELNSGEYYLIPFNCSRGGGLFLSQRNTSWPIFIRQDISQLSNGNSVTVVPVTNNLPAAEQSVRLSSTVHIQFVSCATCLESIAWTIGDPEGTDGRRHVVAGYSRRGHGQSNSQFRIEKNGHGGYRLVFCPKVCKLCRSACENVGVFIEGGKRWLGLGGLPLAIEFKKK